MDWSSLCIEKIATVIDIVLIFICISYFFEPKRRQGKYFGMFFLGFIYVVIIDMTDNLWFQVGSAIIIPFLYEKLYYRGTVIKKAVIPLFLVLGIGVINMITVHGIGTMLLVDMDMLMQPGSNVRVLMLVIDKLLLLAASYGIRFFARRQEFNGNELLIVEILLAGTLVSIVADVKMAVSGDITAENQVYMLISAAGMIFVNIAIYAVTLRMSRQYKNEMETEILLKELENEQQLLQRVDETYEKTRVLQHDLKYYMSAVANLIEAQKYEQAQAEIRRLIGNGMVANIYTYTKSHILNAVLNEKIARCKKEGICYDIKISGSVIRINEMDVSILLSNLLDNAIEAEKNVCDKYILIEMRNVKEMLFVCVANNISDSVLKKNPQMKSSKVDSGEHGFGHISVVNIVENLDGIIQFLEENNKFMVIISVPNSGVCAK